MIKDFNFEHAIGKYDDSVINHVLLLFDFYIAHATEMDRGKIGLWSYKKKTSFKYYL